VLRWLFPRVVSVVSVLIGLMLALDGGPQLLASGWASTTGVVGFCAAGSSPSERMCVVNWGAGDAQRSTTLPLDLADAVPGRPIAIRVDGDSAARPGSVWVAVATTTLGVGLIVLGGVLVFRSPHSPDRPATGRRVNRRAR
jgi:hypothetical protein